MSDQTVGSIAVGIGALCALVAVVVTAIGLWQIPPPKRSWLLCLWCGHDPGDYRDFVGRPMGCIRCRTADAEMSRWQYERFCGKAAIADWNDAALHCDVAAAREP